MEQDEAVIPEDQVTEGTNKLVEKIGKDNVRIIANLGLAAAALLGISGKPNTGVGLGVEIPNPATGEQVSVGVLASSAEGWIPLGLPDIPGKGYKGLQAYTVRIGGASISVYTASVTNKHGETVKTVGIYPGVESALGGIRYTPGAGK